MSTGEPSGGGGGITPAAPWPLEGFGQSVVLTEASEQRLRALRRALRRSDRFALFVVLASTATRGEVVRRLGAWSGQDGVPPLHFLPEGKRGAEALENLLQTAELSREFRGIVIPDAGALLDAKDGHAVQALNVARDTLAGIIPGPLILLLTPTRAAELPRAAPDLFDIRSGTYEVEAALESMFVADERYAIPTDEARDQHRPTSELLEEANRLRALETSAEPPPPAALTDAWLRLGWELLKDNTLDEALAATQEARRLAAVAGYQSGFATASLLEGHVATQRGEADRAEALYHQAIVLYRANQDRRGEALGLAELGDVARRKPDLDTARESYQLALSIFQDLGERLGEARCLIGLGLVALAANEPGDAYRRFLEALDRYSILQRSRGRSGVQLALICYLAYATARAGELDQGLALSEISLEIGRRSRDRQVQTISLELQHSIFAQQNDFLAFFATTLSLHELCAALGEHERQQHYAGILAAGQKQLPPALWSALQQNAESTRQAAINAARERLQQAGRDPYDPPPAS